MTWMLSGRNFESAPVASARRRTFWAWVGRVAARSLGAFDCWGSQIARGARVCSPTQSKIRLVWGTRAKIKLNRDAQAPTLSPREGDKGGAPGEKKLVADRGLIEP